MTFKLNHGIAQDIVRVLEAVNSLTSGDQKKINECDVDEINRRLASMIVDAKRIATLVGDNLPEVDLRDVGVFAEDLEENVQLDAVQQATRRAVKKGDVVLFSASHNDQRTGVVQLADVETGLVEIVDTNGDGWNVSFDAIADLVASDSDEVDWDDDRSVNEYALKVQRCLVHEIESFVVNGERREFRVEGMSGTLFIEIGETAFYFTPLWEQELEMNVQVTYIDGGSFLHQTTFYWTGDFKLDARRWANVARQIIEHHLNDERIQMIELQRNQGDHDSKVYPCSMFPTLNDSAIAR